MFDLDFLDEANQLDAMGPDDPIMLPGDDEITIYIGKCARRWKDCKQYCRGDF